MAIKFLLLQNRQGKTRVSKWYIPVKCVNTAARCSGRPYRWRRPSPGPLAVAAPPRRRPATHRAHLVPRLRQTLGRFEEKAEVEREVHRIVTTRPASYTNFIEASCAAGRGQDAGADALASL